jgi:rhodanese-related sulfurtransferase
MSGARVTDSQQKLLSSVTAAGITGRVPISFVGGMSSSLERVGARGRSMKKDIRRLMMSDDRTPFDFSTFRSINKDKLKEILAEYKTREESGMVLIDVRGEEEIMATGKVSPVAETLPLPYIQQQRVFAMDEQEFLDNFGFEKPRLDETVIFTCKAGIRSKVACQIAIMEGYADVINYSGGANEWFSNN